MAWQPRPSQYRLKVRIEDVGGAWRITISGDINQSVRVEELRRTLLHLLYTGNRVRLEIELRGERLIDLAVARPVDAAPGGATVHRSDVDIVAGSPASEWVFAMLDALTDTDAMKPPSDRPEDDAE
jgi:hypothetical protein